ncbi:hypothetical protein Tco_0801058 [Tanacetum coccineum]|uniref:Uncharacterized protein n=1 Tax=Tanacetum coccineum TaxID=301880 RepID=A0ABQ4ZYS7_9ASTR
MEPDIQNLTLNEYLMYEQRHKVLERSYIYGKRVAPERNRILVYPDSDEEDEEHCWLLSLLLCFQTPQPCTKFNYMPYNVKNEVDIDNMTLEEYDRYELAMSRKKSEINNPIHGGDNLISMEQEEVSNGCDDEKDGDSNHKSVLMKDIEMDEDHDVDHSKIKKALQWILAKELS